MVFKMKIVRDESGQGAAEYILLFGGVIAIVIIAALSYSNYIQGAGNEINTTDVQNVTNAIKDLNNKF
jgi:Flp pilus assembly pilin Flp